MNWQFLSMVVVFNLYLRKLPANIKLVSLGVHANTIPGKIFLLMHVQEHFLYMDVPNHVSCYGRSMSITNR
jgi:hypothetical protein